MSNDIFYIIPFINVTNTATNVKKPCCRYRMSQDEKIKICDVPISKVLTSEVFKNIQQSISNNIPLDGCARCYNEDKFGKSYRKSCNSDAMFLHNDSSILKKYEATPELISLELAFSRDCNLRCLICSSEESTKWDEVWSMVYDSPIISKTFNTEKLLEGIDLSKISSYKIVGGEPFISKNFLDFLTVLDDTTNLTKTKLTISSNATIFPKKQYLDILQKFGKLKIELSIDAVGNANDYIRRKSKWSVIEDVVNNWGDFAKAENITCSIHQTVCVYNVHMIGDVATWCHNIEMDFIFSLLRYPSHLSTKNLPLWYLQKAYENNVANGMDKKTAKIILESEYNIELLHDLKKFTKTLDDHDNLQLRDYIPELHDLLEDIR